jgi:hypothetical protein
MQSTTNPTSSFRAYGAAGLSVGLGVAILAMGCIDLDSGSASIGVSTYGLSSADVTRVSVEITGPNITPPISYDLVKTAGQWKGLIDEL